MCVSFGLADFGKTYIYAAATSNGRHTLIYQNQPQNLMRPPANVLLGQDDNGLVDIWSMPERPIVPGNAMILPIPAAKPIRQADVFVMDSSSRLLYKMWEQTQPVTRGDTPKKDPLIFSRGIYDIVVVNHADTTVGVLDVLEKQVSPEKRPVLNQSILDWFFKSYPGWPLIIACFSNVDQKAADPFGVTYLPKRYDILYMPGMDAHDGNPPVVGASVPVNHVLLFGVDGVSVGQSASEVLTVNGVGSFKSVFADRYVGLKLEGNLSNGDWVIPTSALVDHNFSSRLYRTKPPVMV